MMNTQTFSPAKSFKSVTPFIVAFSFFPVMGIAMIFAGTLLAGLLLCSIGILAISYLIATGLSHGYSYAITQTEVLFKAPLAHKVISLTHLASVTYLTPQAATEFLAECYHPLLNAESRLDLPGWFNSSLRYGDLIRYASLPIINKVTRKGGPLTITGFGVQNSGEAILLCTTNDEYLLTTPKSPDQFKAALIKSGIPNAAISELPLQDLSALTLQATRAKKTKRYLHSTLTLLLSLTLGLGIYAWYNLSTTPPQQTILAPQPSPSLVTAGYWESLTRFIFITTRSTTFTPPSPGALVPDKYSEALQAMVFAYTNIHGGSPKKFLNTEAAQNLSGFLQGSAQNRFLKEVQGNAQQGQIIYSIEGDLLQVHTNKILHSFYSSLK